MEMSQEKEILDLQDQRLAAMAARDYGKLASLVHDELVYTHSHAGVDNKATWLESMTSGRVTYKTARLSDRKVRVYGDVALITGTGVMDVEVGGQPKTMKLRFLEAWTRTPKGWRFVAWQSTSMPA
jgi:ketosteroid isomerase-like protein